MRRTIAHDWRRDQPIAHRFAANPILQAAARAWPVTIRDSSLARSTLGYRTGFTGPGEYHDRHPPVRDPALFAESAIDAETVRLNAQMIELLTGQPKWWVVGMMREYWPMAAPFVERGLGDRTDHGPRPAPRIKSVG